MVLRRSPNKRAIHGPCPPQAVVGPAFMPGGGDRLSGAVSKTRIRRAPFTGLLAVGKPSGVIPAGRPLDSENAHEWASRPTLWSIAARHAVTRAKARAYYRLRRRKAVNGLGDCGSCVATRTTPWGRAPPTTSLSSPPRAQFAAKAAIPPPRLSPLLAVSVVPGRMASRWRRERSIWRRRMDIITMTGHVDQSASFTACPRNRSAEESTRQTHWQSRGRWHTREDMVAAGDASSWCLRLRRREKDASPSFGAGNCSNWG